MLRVFLICLLSLPVAAQTVYKTVEDGVPTFSDAPPAEGPAEVIEVHAPPAADDGLLEERLAEMRETTDRMASDRREREKHRAEMRALSAPDPASETIVVEQPSTLWAGGYWPGYSRPPNRPRPPFRPGPPQRPQPLPQQPGWSVMQPGNSQLMRPMVSSRP
jgi:hypothetical protein